MRHHRVLLALAIIGALCTTALSEEPIVIRGVGAKSCAVFAANYKLTPKLAEMVYDSWAQGFMSGMNISLFFEYKPMRTIPATDQLTSGIRQLCSRRPLADFYQIVSDYFEPLPEGSETRLAVFLDSLQGSFSSAGPSSSISTGSSSMSFAGSLTLSSYE